MAAAGYYFIGGTSEGSPDWAGLAADLDQLAGHPIGLLNPYLYALGKAGIGFHDITVGNNSYDGVPGYSATPGWDAASGWGTPYVGQLLSDIACWPGATLHRRRWCPAPARCAFRCR